MKENDEKESEAENEDEGSDSGQKGTTTREKRKAQSRGGTSSREGDEGRSSMTHSKGDMSARRGEDGEGHTARNENNNKENKEETMRMTGAMQRKGEE